jgi:MFS family permease
VNEGATAYRRGDVAWLVGLCLSRLLIALVFTSYAAVLPVLQREWQMSAAAAGSVASAFQIGYALSLVGFTLLADRIGARLPSSGRASPGRRRRWPSPSHERPRLLLALRSHRPVDGGNYTRG